MGSKCFFKVIHTISAQIHLDKILTVSFSINCISQLHHLNFEQSDNITTKKTTKIIIKARYFVPRFGKTQVFLFECEQNFRFGRDVT